MFAYLHRTSAIHPGIRSNDYQKQREPHLHIARDATDTRVDLVLMVVFLMVVFLIIVFLMIVFLMVVC